MTIATARISIGDNFECCHSLNWCDHQSDWLLHRHTVVLYLYLLIGFFSSCHPFFGGCFLLCQQLIVIVLCFYTIVVSLAHISTVNFSTSFKTNWPYFIFENSFAFIVNSYLAADYFAGKTPLKVLRCKFWLLFNKVVGGFSYFNISQWTHFVCCLTFGGQACLYHMFLPICMHVSSCNKTDFRTRTVSFDIRAPSSPLFTIWSRRPFFHSSFCFQCWPNIVDGKKKNGQTVLSTVLVDFLRITSLQISFHKL